MTDRFLERRRRRRRAQVAALERGLSDPSWGVAISRVTGRVRNDDPYTGHATVYACVRTTVEALISAPLVPVDGPTEDAAVLTSGPWFEWLRRPNPLQTRREFVEAFATHLELDGEVGIYYEGERGPARIDEVPREAWPIPGGSLQEVLDERTRLLLGWRVTTAAGTIEVPEHALTLLRYYNPKNPIRGLSQIAAAATGLRSDLKAEAWGEAFFDNSAEPGMILSTEGALTPDQRREMREAWEERHRGVSRSHRVAVLEGGLTAQTIGIPQRDMEYLEQRRWNEGQIAKVFRVPKFFLMAQEDISYASTRQNKRALWELKILPLIARFEDSFDARLTATRDGEVRLRFDLAQVDALSDDLDALLGSAERATRLGYPLNQVNERLGLGMPRQAWGDEGLLPMGVAPAEDVAEGVQFGGGLEPLDEGDDPENPEDDPLPQEDKPGETGENGDVEPVRFGIRTKETADEGRARRSAAWRVLERGTLRPGTGKFRRRIEGFMRGRRAEILRFLAGLRGARALETPGSIEQFLAEAEERWAKMIRKQTRPLYREIVAQAANGISRELGGLQIFTMGDPSVARFLAQKDVLIQQVPKTLVEALRGSLIEGLDRNEDVNDLQDRARLVLKAGRNRSLTIARTETSSSVNGSRHLAMQVERVESSEWLTADDEFVRNEPNDGVIRLRPPANHRVLDGQVQPIGATFVPGATLRYPGDMEAPASQRINCRCGAAPKRA